MAQSWAQKNELLLNSSRFFKPVDVLILFENSFFYRRCFIVSKRKTEILFF